MLKPIYLVAFSGHRPNDDPGRSDRELLATAPLIRDTLIELRQKCEASGGELHFLSSLAAGADIIAVNEARKLGLPLHIILPKTVEAFFHEDFQGSSATWKNAGIQLLQTAHQHCPLTPGSFTTDDALRIDFPNPKEPFVPEHTFRTLQRNENSPDCYASVNVRMLESADLLISVWDEQQNESVAGTSHVASQARALELPHININPISIGTNEVRSDLRLENFAIQNDDSAELLKSFSNHLNCELENSGQPFHDLASCLEKVANESASRFRSSTALAIGFHAFAGFIAAGAAASYYALTKYLPGEKLLILCILAFLELLLVAAAYFLEKKSHQRRERDVWLDYRFASEILRGQEHSHFFQDPLFPDIRRHHPSWGRFAVATGLLLRRQYGTLNPDDSACLQTAKKIFRIKRVLGQRKYFSINAKKARPIKKNLLSLAHWVAPAALAVILIAFIAKSYEAVTNHPLLVFQNPWLSALILLFLPVFLPLLASLSASFFATFDFGRRTTRYAEMVSFLDETNRWLKTLKTHSNIVETVQRTEEVLLDENIEWLAAQKSGLGH